jgi:hypothetical protein
MAITKWSIPRVNCALLIKSYRSYKSYRRTPAEFELAIFKTGRGAKFSDNLLSLVDEVIK